MTVRDWALIIVESVAITLAMVSTLAAALLLLSIFWASGKRESTIVSALVRALMSDEERLDRRRKRQIHDVEEIGS